MQERVIFLSPHPDDETLFGAFTLLRRKPCVVVCSDADEPEYALIRRKECMEAMNVLGCHVEFLGIREQDFHADTLRRALVRYSPDKVYAPAPSRHIHHSLLSNIAYELWGEKVVLYATYTAESLTPHGDFAVVPNEIERLHKKQALMCYKSQFENPGVRPHFDAVNGKPEFLNLMNPPKVSACLIDWKRHAEIKEIREYLLTVPFIDEILIHGNTPIKNSIDYGRFLAAARAKNDIIYVQDDDYLVQNLGELYATFDGKRMSNNVQQERMSEYGPQALSSVVGWGAFFKKEWLALFDRYLEVYGKDYILRREAGRIFSVLCEGRNTLPVGDTAITPFASAINEDALYRQPGHWICGAIAIGRALELKHGNEEFLSR